MGMKGKIALCSLGCLGLITNDEKQSVSYTTLVDGALSGEAYVGIHLQDTAHAKLGIRGQAAIRMWSEMPPH